MATRDRKAKSSRTGNYWKKLPDNEFIDKWRMYGPTEMSRRTGMSLRSLYSRRRVIEMRTGQRIEPPIPNPGELPVGPTQAPGRINTEVRNGFVLIGSDAHYWPGDRTLMHKAFLYFCKELKPKIVVMNGDVIDAPTVSRYDSGWEKIPQLADEIEHAKDMLSEIEKATFKTPRYWPLGNHDARFEYRIAAKAPEYAKIHGIHLKDHFPNWIPTMSLWLNDGIIIKHRFKGGIHAIRNNTLYGGKTIVTAHLHAARVHPFTDYNGTRWGVDNGCMANVYAPQFNYLEDNPRDWREGLCVLKIVDGRLLEPSLVLRWDDKSVQFRGDIIRV